MSDKCWRSSISTKHKCQFLFLETSFYSNLNSGCNYDPEISHLKWPIDRLEVEIYQLSIISRCMVDPVTTIVTVFYTGHLGAWLVIYSSYQCSEFNEQIRKKHLDRAGDDPHHQSMSLPL